MHTVFGDSHIYDAIKRMPRWCSNIDAPALRALFEQVVRQNTFHDDHDGAPVTLSDNLGDDLSRLWEFHYSDKVLHNVTVPEFNRGELKGCACEGDCRNSHSCACLTRQRRYFTAAGYRSKEHAFNYNSAGQIVDHRFPVFECNEECGCDNSCVNRVGVLLRSLEYR